MVEVKEVAWTEAVQWAVMGAVMEVEETAGAMAAETVAAVSGVGSEVAMVAVAMVVV